MKSGLVEEIQTEGSVMRGKKTQDPRKTGTLRPWLVDVVIEDLR